MDTELLTLILIMASGGVVSGLLAGLLGVGGGIINVPVLYTAFGMIGVDESIRMHMAVATSMAIIVPTSIRSGLAHAEKGAVVKGVLKAWGPFIVIGALIAGFAASNITSDMLILFFATMVGLMGLKMFFWHDVAYLKGRNELGFLGRFVATFIGGASSLMGIGGASFSVPFMTMFAYPPHFAVGTASWIGLIIAVPATLAYLLGVPDIATPAYSIGYINGIGFIGVAVTSVFMAPYGARLAHRMDARVLSWVFGGFLLLTSLRMFWPVVMG
ncbi:MAG: sulfite exporter TauE/SafE family protein [Sphingomonadales bacterium]|nr:sulfite exporter TauE/SafE family protein [Sphingomonadales bacterium]